MQGARLRRNRRNRSSKVYNRFRALGLGFRKQKGYPFFCWYIIYGNPEPKKGKRVPLGFLVTEGEYRSRAQGLGLRANFGGSGFVVVCFEVPELIVWGRTPKNAAPIPSVQ